MAGPGGFDMMGMLQKAQQQAETMKRQLDAQLREKTVEGTTGGGVVKVVVTGTLEVKKVTIDPAVIDPKERDMLEDLVAAAVNVALKKAKELAAEAQKGQVQGMLGGAGGGLDIGKILGGGM